MLLFPLSEGINWQLWQCCKPVLFNANH